MNPFELRIDPYARRLYDLGLYYPYLELGVYNILLMIFTNFSCLYYRQSTNCLLLNDLDSALEYIMRALALKPNSFKYRDRLIYILILLARYDEALTYLDRVNFRRLRIDKKGLRLAKYSYLYFKMGDYQKALFYNDKYWFLYKNSYTQMWLRGQILHHVGRYNESTDFMLKSIGFGHSKTPQYTTAHIIIGKNYELLGEYEQSMHYIEKALSCYFSDKREKRNLKLKLKNIQEKASQKKFN
jgi:tetratricopeptide (TPR) repeat protein